MKSERKENAERKRERNSGKMVRDEGEKEILGKRDPT